MPFITKFVKIYVKYKYISSNITKFYFWSKGRKICFEDSFRGLSDGSAVKNTVAFRTRV